MAILGDAMNIMLLGPPGSGKGTVGKKISFAFKIPQISTGDILRDELRRETMLSTVLHQYMDYGILVPDSLTMTLLEQRIKRRDCRKGFILDGFPRTIKQAALLEKKKIRINKVLIFDVPLDIVYDRVANRRTCSKCGAVFNTKTMPPKKDGVCDVCGNALYSRNDQKPGVIEQRLKIYKNETLPLIDYYRKKKMLIVIDATRKPKEVQEETIKLLK